MAPLADVDSQQVVEVGESLPLDDAMGTKAMARELERAYDELMEEDNALLKPSAAALLEDSQAPAAEPAAGVTDSVESSMVAEASPATAGPSSQPVLMEVEPIRKSKAHEERGPSTYMTLLQL